MKAYVIIKGGFSQSLQSLTEGGRGGQKSEKLPYVIYERPLRVRTKYMSPQIFFISLFLESTWKTLNFVAQRLDDGSRSKSICDWEPSEKLDYAKKCYEKGVELIRSKNYKGAFKMLRQASALTIFIQGFYGKKSAFETRLFFFQ